MMKLLTLALLFGVGAAASLRTGTDACVAELNEAKTHDPARGKKHAGDPCKKKEECYSFECGNGPFGDGKCKYLNDNDGSGVNSIYRRWNSARDDANKKDTGPGGNAAAIDAFNKGRTGDQLVGKTDHQKAVRHFSTR